MEYNFTLVVTLASASDDGEEAAEALLEGGCEDATIAIGRPGFLYADFGREADSAADAIGSAMRDCSNALQGSAVTVL